jgi:predicted ABC-type ATPase
LPEILNCREFVNADNIAAGLSPFNPEKVALAAGRIMLKRIFELLIEGSDFAFETTLSTRSYVSLINEAHQRGYNVTLLFFWLDSPFTAYDRVAKRVSEGGHNTLVDVIERRYFRGIKNLLDLYVPVCDGWFVINSVGVNSKLVAKGGAKLKKTILNLDIWKIILTQCNDSSK